MINLRAKLRGREGFCTAVAAMITGINNQDERDDFTINMEEYGDYLHDDETGETMCFGCAATCAIQEYFGVDFDEDDIRHDSGRAAAVNLNLKTYNYFEGCVDGLRRAEAYHLADFCQLNENDKAFVMDSFAGLRELDNCSWERNLYEYEDVLNGVMDTWGMKRAILQ